MGAGDGNPPAPEPRRASRVERDTDARCCASARFARMRDDGAASGASAASLSRLVMSRRSRLDHVGVGREPRRLGRQNEKCGKRTTGSRSREPMRCARGLAARANEKRSNPGEEPRLEQSRMLERRSEGALRAASPGKTRRAIRPGSTASGPARLSWRGCEAAGITDAASRTRPPAAR
jgi:hypothetical protein